MKSTASRRMYRRITSTPRARLLALAQLLEFICSFHCMEHGRRPGIDHVENGRVAYTACCEYLLDVVERALDQPATASTWRVAAMVM